MHRIRLLLLLLLVVAAAPAPSLAQPDVWIGSVAVSGDWLSGGTLNETLFGLVAFEYVHTDPSGSWVYEPALADLTWSMSGSADGCAYSGGPLEFEFAPSEDEWGELWIHADGVYEGHLHVDVARLRDQVRVACPGAEPFQLDGRLVNAFSTGLNFFEVRGGGLLLQETYSAFGEAGAMTFEWELEAEGATPVAPDPATAPSALSPPYPNPTGSEAHLSLTLERSQPVRIDVLDARGRRVGTLHDGPAPAGVLPLTLRGGDLPNGLYFVRLEAANAVTVRAVTIQR